MKDIKLSAPLVSASVGLIICYSISIALFWESKSRLFYIDPANSYFTRFLFNIMDRETAKWVGIITAFLSIHASWWFKTRAGKITEQFVNKVIKKQQQLKTLQEKEEIDLSKYSSKLTAEAAKTIETTETTEAKKTAQHRAKSTQ